MSKPDRTQNLKYDRLVRPTFLPPRGLVILKPSGRAIWMIYQNKMYLRSALLPPTDRRV